MQAAPRDDTSTGNGREYVDANRLLRVLIVDEDDADRLIVRRSLVRSNLPLDVHEAATGPEGLRKLAELPFDCIFVDDSLPGEALDELFGAATAGDSPCVATVLLTSAGHEFALAAGHCHRAQDYLEKSELAVGAVRRALLRAVDTAALLRQVREQGEALAQSERDLARYARVTATRLAAPVDAIVGLVGQLGSCGRESLDARSQDCLDRIAEGLLGLQRTVAGMSAIGIIGRDAAAFERCDSGDLLSAAVAAIEPELCSARTEVSWSRLPAIDCQPRRIVQLFEELLRHAIRQRAGATRIEIRVAARALAISAVERLAYAAAARHRTVWEFRIAHAGNAAPPAGNGKRAGAQLAEGREDEAATAGDDAATRVAVCRRIVEIHRGRICFETEAAGGAVRFTLPGTQGCGDRPRSAER